MRFKLQEVKSVGGGMAGQFKGIGEILAGMTDLGGRRTALYTVPNTEDGCSARAGSFRMAVGYDPQYHQFTVLQSFPGKPYRNSFTVSDEGEVTSFCDYLPGGSLIESFRTGDGLPTSFERFDLRFCAAEDPIQHVTTLAVDAVTQLGARGVLDKNINPSAWQGRRSR